MINCTTTKPAWLLRTISTYGDCRYEYDPDGWIVAFERTVDIYYTHREEVHTGQLRAVAIHQR